MTMVMLLGSFGTGAIIGGGLNDFVDGSLHNLLFWDIFYVTDFIMMAGALFWYYRFHVSPERRKMKITG
ncbi:MAG TPA: hypothetical protein VK553_01625 [Candidatus Nitrosopolaris rasttigaisensis]|jgi:hypothetical protein|nr:hypothetical protein [Candidatus Nitrosopolaris rasttigaisensis]